MWIVKKVGWVYLMKVLLLCGKKGLSDAFEEKCEREKGGGRWRRVVNVGLDILRGM